MADYQNSTFKEIDLEDIIVGQVQVRTSTFGDTSELAKSIKTSGLLQPIRVTPKNKDGKHEIILGQRRYIAFRELVEHDKKFSKIPCFIDSRKLDVVDYKILSISENFFRQPNSELEKIEAFEAAFNKYATIKSVAEKMGCSSSTARKYIKTTRLPKLMRESIDNGEISADHALTSYDKICAAQGQDSLDDKEDIEMAIELAKDLKGVSAPIKKNLLDKIPNNSPIEGIDALKAKVELVKNPNTNRVEVNFGVVEFASIEASAEEKGIDNETVVHDYTIERLKEDEFLDE